jgi:hypothetical protein
MTAPHQQDILSRIEDAWRELRDALDAVPTERLDEAGVEGPWSVRDLIGHISTWEDQAVESIGRYLPRRDLTELAWVENIDEFNTRAVAEKRVTPLADLMADLERTHTGLLSFVEGVPEDALSVTEVEARIRIDTFAHYAEHAATIGRWLARGQA